mgnify:CR=1 FL=1
MDMHKIDVAAVAERLSEPFLMEQIARVDHFGVYLYLCEGFVPRHHHMSRDEMFYVYKGLFSVQVYQGLGTANAGQRYLNLSDDELTVIPRGLAHETGSLIRTICFNLQAQSDPERKNGHSRLTVDDIAELPKWSISREAERLGEPCLPIHLAQVDEMSLRLVECEGTTAWHRHPHHDEMLFVREGALGISTEAGQIELAPDELYVIPRDQIHRLSATQPTLVVSLIHGEVSIPAHMGLEK